jgi:uncharacterized cupredoxin-like copper-binding protein
MYLPRSILVAVAGVALVAAACGDDNGNTSAGSGDDVRTVEIDMVDNAFEPETLQVAQGEAVRFVFNNSGEVAHDAYIGDRDAQADHEAEMREGDDDDAHDGGHGEDEGENAVTVDPGDTEELTYTFDDTGTLEVGCHQPGHYDAGMKITVEVA